MPPKSTYKRENIIAAALCLVEEQGTSALTARGVASVLGSSTAPVYRCFATMTELEDAVVERILEQIHECCMVERTDSPFLDMGVGWSIFARDHRNLWRMLFVEGEKHRAAAERLTERLLPRLGVDPLLASLDEAQRVALMNKMAIITHGLATLICQGFMDRSDDVFIIGTLRMLGRPVIGEALAEAEGIAPVDLDRYRGKKE